MIYFIHCSNMQNIVLVWAWWTGMSGVAWLLHDLWYSNIICIDGFQSELTDNLEKKWLKVIIGHNKYEINNDDIFLYSEATVDSPEIQKARNIAKENTSLVQRPGFEKKKKIPLIMNYFQFLGEISKYFITVGFTWTNGKSSSTALWIFGAKDVLPNFGLGILGALVPDFNNQSYYLNPAHKPKIKWIFDYILTEKSPSTVGKDILKSLYFFVEACEYKRHFLNLDLDYAIITSLELDHTDYYKDKDDYLDAFHTLANKTKKWILIPEHLAFHTDKTIKVKIEDINFTSIRGDYANINWSLVLALLDTLGSKDPDTSQISNFKWLWRRMELLWKNKNWASIYSDYGHMASSIAWGYEALKKRYPDYKIQVIFQPHQINRIFLGRKDFIQALKLYDQIKIYDIYAARENREELIKKFESTIPWAKASMNLEELGSLFAKACEWSYSTDINDIIKIINNADNKTIVVIFSAGDVDYKIRKYLFDF